MDGKIITVVIADDSAFMRMELKRIIEVDPMLKVVASARNGEEALAKVRELEPDVVALDINMPVMDGITALQHIMMTCPRPCLMISSLTKEGAVTTFEALELGAADFVAKPSGTISKNMGQAAVEIRSKLRNMASAKVRGVRHKRIPAAAGKASPGPAARKLPVGNRVIVIGESTGGPNTILDILPLLPADLGVPVLLVQHMPGTFTASFAERLNGVSQLKVVHGCDGQALDPGTVYVAPGDRQMTVVRKSLLKKGPVLRVSATPETLYMPNVDITLASALEIYGNGCIGVLLTGMGADGAESMAKVRQAGGRTIAESEETAIIFGMPKEAIRLNGAEFILPSYKIAEAILNLLRSGV